MKHLLAACTLLSLLFLLHQVWPSEAVDALLGKAGVTEGPAGAGQSEARLGSLDAPGVSEVPASAMRVLFIGNSHTHLNRMPSMIARLARAAEEPRPFWYAMVAPGGARLEDHVRDGQAAARLRSGKWDYVVLQEQQQWPSFSREQRRRELHPPARKLHAAASAVGAKTVLFMTWARRDGDRFNRPDDSFEAMHARLRAGYYELAQDLGVEIVPVGTAWRWALQKRPDLPLFAPDGYHAAPLGSYLAACSFYAALYGRSPEGNPFTAGLSPADAALVQHAAIVARAMQ